jgi:hypothetical protein
MLRKLLVLLALVAGVAATGAGATAPQPVAIEMNGQFTPTSATSGVVTGTWQATGAVADSGTYTETVELIGHSIHVTKILTGTRGTIVLKGQGVYDVVAGGTVAVFRAGSWEFAGGTGAYENLHGGGQPVATADSFGSFVTGQVHVTHVGRAHYD